MHEVVLNFLDDRMLIPKLESDDTALPNHDVIKY